MQAGSATLGDGRALPLSRIAVQTALELSDELNVDEMVAVELIVVTNQEVRHPCSHVPGVSAVHWGAWSDRDAAAEFGD